MAAPEIRGFSLLCRARSVPVPGRLISEGQRRQVSILSLIKHLISLF
jgi:hypothetical protein